MSISDTTEPTRDFHESVFETRYMKFYGTTSTDQALIVEKVESKGKYAFIDKTEILSVGFSLPRETLPTKKESVIIILKDSRTLLLPLNLVPIGV